MFRSHSIGRFLQASSEFCLADSVLDRIFEPYRDVVEKLGLRDNCGCIQRDRLRTAWATDPQLFDEKLHLMFATIQDLSDIEDSIAIINAMPELNIPRESWQTVADMAALIALTDANRATEIAALHRKVRRRRLRIFYARVASLPRLSADVESRVESFRRALAAESAEQLRTRYVKTFPALTHQRLAIHVIRADNLKRTPAIDAKTETRTCIPLHPEYCDTLTYDASIGQLRINARRDSDINWYLTHFGEHLFDDRFLFPREFDPNVFKVDGMMASYGSFGFRDVPGIVRVESTALTYRPRGVIGRVWRTLAPDGLAAASMPLRSILPPHATPHGMDFTFHLSTGRERSVRIEYPNVMLLSDDEEGDLAVRWFLNRGLMNNAEEALRDYPRDLWDAA
jgi:hypothetical protein